jgi:hypothetical protein
MALIKTIAEIKDVLPKFIPNNLDSKVLPNFDQVEAKYLVPLVGIEFYNSLVTKYNGNSLSTDENVLVKKMRLVACAYAFRDEQGYGYVNLTENGMRKILQAQNGELKKWEFEKVAAGLTTLAADATETLLQYLYEKKFALWTASEVYQNFQKFLIRTGSDFSSHYALYQPMRTFLSLRTVILHVQTLYITQGIGADLLTYLLALDPIPEGLKTGMDFLKTSLCFFAIMEACNQLNVQFSDAGFTVLNGTSTDIEEAGRTTADGETLRRKMESANTRGNDFLCLAQTELVKYYNAEGAAAAGYKTALEKGPLKDFLQPKEGTSGNERRKIFVL